MFPQLSNTEFLLLLVTAWCVWFYDDIWRQMSRETLQETRKKKWRRLKPQTPDDCELCRLGIHKSKRPLFRKVAPWSEVKSRAGAKKKSNSEGRACPQRCCTYYGITDSFCCLIRDNDKKYIEAFDTVFESQQTSIVPTPIQAPKANSYMERWIRSVRQECFDHILIINEAHLRRVLNEYLAYYNARRPHQGLEQQSPIPRPEPVRTGRINRRQVLGGIINDYFRSQDKSAVCPT